MLNFFRGKPLTGLPQLTQMKIVCADCGGDQIKPVETNLMSDGSCAKCAGRSYACAERLSKVLARYLLSQSTEVNK